MNKEIFKISVISIKGNINNDKHTVNDSNFIKEMEKMDESHLNYNLKTVICTNMEKGIERLCYYVAKTYLYGRLKHYSGKTNLEYQDFNLNLKVVCFTDNEPNSEIMNDTEVWNAWDSNSVWANNTEPLVEAIMHKLDINDQILYHF